MSENIGKKIKILAVIIGVAGAAASFTMAFVNLENLVFAFSWIVFAVLSLLLIIPLYFIGMLADVVSDNRERLRLLYEKQKRASKDASPLDTMSVDRYSPASRVRIQKVATGTMKQVNTGTSSQPVYTPANVTGPKSEDFTREFGTTAREAVKINRDAESAVIRNASTEEATAVFPAAAGAPRPQETSKPADSSYISSFFTTTSIDRIKVDRRDNSVTRFLTVPIKNTFAAGGLHTVAVRRGGTAIATGFGTYGQCDVSSWTGLVSVAAGNHHTVGLKSNGTCVACGFNGYKQCEVGDWSNICSVSAGVGHTVGLLENGTCVACGDNTYGQCNIADWADIIAISAGYNYTVGLRADGTIIAVGANTDGNWGANRWGSIIAVAAGGLHTVGLRGDGTCVACGNNANDQCDVSRFNGVKAVAAGNYHTVALLASGKVAAIGFNGYNQCGTGDWSGAVAVSAGRNHTLALTGDGRLLACGDNTYGQCTVSAFRDIMAPKA